MSVINKVKDINITMVTDENIEHSKGKFDSNTVYEEIKELIAKKALTYADVKDLNYEDIKDLTFGEMCYIDEILNSNDNKGD